jgi:hypothetical protein
MPGYNENNPVTPRGISISALEKLAAQVAVTESANYPGGDCFFYGGANGAVMVVPDPGTTADGGKVFVDANDTTLDFLGNKLVAGVNASFSIDNVDEDEALTINALSATSYLIWTGDQIDLDILANNTSFWFVDCLGSAVVLHSIKNAVEGQILWVYNASGNTNTQTLTIKYQSGLGTVPNKISTLSIQYFGTTFNGADIVLNAGEGAGLVYSVTKSGWFVFDLAKNTPAVSGSVVQTAAGYQLANDLSSPSSLYCYGTDGTGKLGWVPRANTSITATVATTTALPAYTPSSSGTHGGETLTFNATGVVAVDGHNLALGDVLLVKNESSGQYNGAWTVTTAPAIGVGGVLTRTVGMDESLEFPGALVYVEIGSTNTKTTWQCQNTSPPNVGTDPIVFAQFGVSSGGSGLTEPQIWCRMVMGRWR